MRKSVIGVLFVLLGVMGLGVGSAAAEPIDNNKQVAIGTHHSCALTRQGRVMCWGSNGFGQLGDGTDASQSAIPVSVQGVGGSGELTRVRQIAASDDATCALLTTRRVVCWGQNYLGQLGDGTTTDSNTPVEVKGIGGSGELTNVRQLAAGHDHFCALKTNKQVNCWGYGDQGQLGDNLFSGSSTPVLVKSVDGTGALTKVKQVAAGGKHTCALAINGRVTCWGDNYSGQVGNGRRSSQNGFPVEVKGVGADGLLAQVAQLAAGGGHTCALKTSGQLNCWGKNFSGELGNGTTTNSTTPVVVKGIGGSGVLEAAKGVTTGAHHSCALLRNGRVTCWGSSFNGQLGNGTDGLGVGSSTPVVVQQVGGGDALSRIRQLDAHGHSCALSVIGQVVCWGRNPVGQLGDGTNNDSNLPVLVQASGSGPPSASGLTKVKQVAAGDFHTCALFANGRVNCWGRNTYGQLGDGTTTDSNRPVVVQAVGGDGELTKVKQITAGASHTCALLNSGQVNCWGVDRNGQLGDGVGAGPSDWPVVVQAVGGGGELTKVKQIAAGDYHTCALLTTGRVNCWGANISGALGDGTNGDSNLPVVVQAVVGGGELARVKQIAAGEFHTCALLSSGRVNCWGDNFVGQLGDGTTIERDRPVVVQAVGGDGELGRVKQIAAGEVHTCALLTTGRVNCWGFSLDGQVGHGTAENDNGQLFNTPVVVQAAGGGGELTKVKQITNGGRHTCALLTTGRANCWGRGIDGQLGAGTGISRSHTPVSVQAVGGGSEITGVKQITAGAHHTCALMTTGRVNCWGRNEDGQLGTGANTASTVPVPVVAAI